MKIKQLGDDDDDGGCFGVHASQSCQWESNHCTNALITDNPGQESILDEMGSNIDIRIVSLYIIFALFTDNLDQDTAVHSST